MQLNVFHMFVLPCGTTGKKCTTNDLCPTFKCVLCWNGIRSVAFRINVEQWIWPVYILLFCFLLHSHELYKEIGLYESLPIFLAETALLGTLSSQFIVRLRRCRKCSPRSTYALTTQVLELAFVTYRVGVCEWMLQTPWLKFGFMISAVY